MIFKLRSRKPTVQDESSLAALAQSSREKHCELPQDQMTAAYLAALSHHEPSARLLAQYSDYCWNILSDRALAIKMIDEAVQTAPKEAAYLIKKIRMLAVESKRKEAHDDLDKLQTLNYGGRLDTDLSNLRALPGLR